MEERGTNTTYIIGDFLINKINGKIAQIVDFDDAYGYQIDMYGTKFHLSEERINHDYRIWGIGDAKPGDVLHAKGYTFIFNENNDWEILSSYCSYSENNGFDNKPNEGICYANEARPASSEQFSRLFDAMKKEGYRWNSKKLKLKKRSIEDTVGNYCDNEKYYNNMEPKIDIDRLFVSFLTNTEGDENCRWVSALNEQGLTIRDGNVVDLPFDGIEEGNVYKCIESLFSENGTVYYAYDNIYPSEKAGCITDADGDKSHYIPADIFEKHFMECELKGYITFYIRSWAAIGKVDHVTNDGFVRFSEIYYTVNNVYLQDAIEPIFDLCHVRTSTEDDISRLVSHRPEKLNIKAGNWFVCIEDVVMDDGDKTVAYQKGKAYQSECDGCITDEQSDRNHFWTYPAFDHFRPWNISDAKPGQYIYYKRNDGKEKIGMVSKIEKGESTLSNKACDKIIFSKIFDLKSNGIDRESVTIPSTEFEDARPITEDERESIETLQSKPVQSVKEGYGMGASEVIKSVREVMQNMDTGEIAELNGFDARNMLIDILNKLNDLEK